jgi:hypothetical protein
MANRAYGWARCLLHEAGLNTFCGFWTESGEWGHLWLAASRRAEVGVVARQLANAQLQDARAVYNLRGACGCGSDFLSMLRGARFASGKIGRQGARGRTVFSTARQTGLWLLDADSRMRDSVYEKPRLNHSIYRGRNHSTYHVERTVATLNCHQ